MIQTRRFAMNKKPTYKELYQMYTEACEDALFYKHQYHETELLLDAFINYSQELADTLSAHGLL